MSIPQVNHRSKGDIQQDKYVEIRTVQKKHFNLRKDIKETVVLQGQKEMNIILII